MNDEWEKKTWAQSDINFEHALEVLAERFPGDAIEILEAFDIAYSGWECDYKGALITRNGVAELVIVDSTGGDWRPVTEQLEERLLEYRRLIEDTERVLGRYREMAGDGGDDA